MAKINKVLYNIDQRNDTTSAEKKTARDNIGAAANILVSVTENGLMSSVDKIKLDSIASGAEVNVQSDWNQTDTSADDYIKNKPEIVSQVQSDWNQSNTSAVDYIKNKPDIPEMEWVQHNQGGDAHYKADKLTIDQDYLSVILNGTEVGSATLGMLVPNPASTPDKDKVLHLAEGSDTPQWTDMPTDSVAYVSTSDTYATVKGYIDAGKEVILRVYPSSNDLYQDFYLSQVNPDGSMEFYCTRSGSGYVIEYQYVLRTNNTWTRLDTSVSQYNGIEIDGIGRNLHLNQNKYVQTNFPGGLFDAPTSMSNSFERITGSDFAGAYMLGCRYNTSGTYELALIYTASGMTGTYSFIGTETVIGLDNSVTVNQAAYIGLTSYYTPTQRFGGTAATPFNPSVHKAILYSGLAEIGPTSNTQIAIWQDNGDVKIGMTSIEVGKVGSTV